MVQKVRFSTFLGFALALLLNAAFERPAVAADPQFYPNQKYKSATVSQLQQDVGDCRANAQAYLQGQQPKGAAARKGVRTAAKGAAAGALAGVVTGQNVGRATGAGAAVGGAAGTVRGLRERGDNNPEYQKYATICLEEKGYKVVGWK